MTVPEVWAGGQMIEPKGVPLTIGNEFTVTVTKADATVVQTLEAKTLILFVPTESPGTNKTTPVLVAVTALPVNVVPFNTGV